MQMYHDISGRVSCSMSWHVPGLLQSDVLQLLWPNHVSLLKEEARDQCFASRKDLSQEIYGQNTFIVATFSQWDRCRDFKLVSDEMGFNLAFYYLVWCIMQLEGANACKQLPSHTLQRLTRLGCYFSISFFLVGQLGLMHFVQKMIRPGLIRCCY